MNLCSHFPETHMNPLIANEILYCQAQTKKALAKPSSQRKQMEKKHIFHFLEIWKNHHIYHSILVDIFHQKCNSIYRILPRFSIFHSLLLYLWIALKLN